MPLITINVQHEDMTRLVCSSIHESIKNLASMYNYTNYPEYVEQDLAALNRVYYYYAGKELEV